VIEREETVPMSSEDPLADVVASLRPYRGEIASFERLPPDGRDRAKVLADLEAMAARERARWEDGYASGAVYHGDPEHIAFLSAAYTLHSQSNPLHVDLWPSTTKLEAEIVAMTADLLGAAHTEDDIVGVVSSGGTESVMLAVKAHRDHRGVERPQMVLPTTAHAAFDKAAHCFGVEAVKVPVGPDMRADVAAMERAITDRTILLVGSTPCYPYGVVDPMAELAEVGRARGIGVHADACLGGFILPFAERLGRAVPPFDFRVPGVTSMTADTHKYGYAAKGTSVVLYRGEALRHAQYFAFTEWPGGLYMTPTFAGSRPGALSAACWAALTSIGEAGYVEAARGILTAAATIRAGVEAIPELRVLGDPLFCIAFAMREDALAIYRVMDAMSARGWSLNGLHHPPAVHICTTLRHAAPGVADRFVSDLRASVAEVAGQPPSESGMAPVYGMAATLPDRGAVAAMLHAFMDLWYRP
jgi:glutamate/tyrosine decarboxylase-like PLP-dependent enzyme